LRPIIDRQIDNIRWSRFCIDYQSVNIWTYHSSKKHSAKFTIQNMVGVRSHGHCPCNPILTYKGSDIVSPSVRSPKSGEVYDVASTHGGPWMCNPVTAWL
jgi:hypothetical protein